MLIGSRIFPVQHHKNQDGIITIIPISSLVSTILIMTSLSIFPPDTQRSYPMKQLHAVLITCTLTCIYSAPSLYHSKTTGSFTHIMTKAIFTISLIHWYVYCASASRYTIWISVITWILICLLTGFVLYIICIHNQRDLRNISMPNTKNSGVIICLLIGAILFSSITFQHNGIFMLHDTQKTSMGNQVTSNQNPLLGNIYLSVSHRKRDFYTLRFSSNKDSHYNNNGTYFKIIVSTISRIGLVISSCYRFTQIMSQGKLFYPNHM